jgi:hypothetical protein
LFNSGEAPGRTLLLALREAGQGGAGRHRDFAGNARRDDWHDQSRVNFFMKKFQRLGFIHYKEGRLTVNSSC